ncbi:MAG: WD40 repeat domain-containing protein [Actinobacteria bacterium]|nr:WD40 repeat domain-containing protein [Actinomycetota bacterium]
MPPSMAPLPESTEQRPSIKPWVVAATVVGLGVVLSILTIPSGFQRVTAPTAPPVITTTTTTIPRPGADRPAYEPAAGTWLGLLKPDTPPETLTGTFPFLEPAFDVLPDGSLLTVTDEAYVRVTPDGGHTPLPIPVPADLLDAALSPNGRLLATVDLDGHPTVWDLETGASLELDRVSYPSPPRAASLHWSADSMALGLGLSEQSYYVWSVEGPLLQGPTAGRLIAVSRLAAVGEDEEGLRINGGFHILPRTAISDIRIGVLSPDAKYLAVDATITGEGSGIWLLNLMEPIPHLLAPANSPFTWSGDGTALYWADETGTYAHPVGPRFTETLISDTAAEPGDRLRVYDPALVPTSTPLVDTGPLFELRDSVLFRRDPDGLHLIDPADTGTTTSIQAAFSVDPATPLLRTAAFGLDTVDVLLLDTTGTTERTLGSLPAGAATVTAIVNNADLGVLLETDNREILRAGPAGLTTVLSGSSLGVVGTVPFAVSQTSSSILTVPPEGEDPEVLIHASDLPGVRGLLAAVGVRSDLLVLVQQQIGVPAVLWIPGDSELLRDIVLPNAPMSNATPFSLIYTNPQDLQITSGRIVPADDAQTFAVEMHSPDGALTLIMADPGMGLSTCSGIVACVTDAFDGTVLGFSPDGSWLLANIAGRLEAISTRGRGRVVIDIAAPDQVAWIPSP